MSHHEPGPEPPDPTANPEPTGENAGQRPAGGLPPMVPDFVEQELQESMDNIVPTRGYQMMPMVGLGGSAGSIRALQEFFRAMPADSGMTFVVILHLSPTHHSTLPELLARTTPMSVVQAEDGQRVEPDHVYVIPPGKHLATVDGHLRLTELEPERGRRVAVDLFFRSLADTHGPHALAIVLSGADGDGAVGLKRIKERGGLTIVQDPDEAEHPSMPRSSIETGMVDWVLQVKQIPHRLLEYQRHETQVRLPPEDGPQPGQTLQPSADAAEEALRDVLVYLRTRTGRDFSYYKRATIVRRVGRRMQINGVDAMPGYLDFLRTHPGETDALLQDLLISVTNFFRDRDAFNALETHIPVLFEDKGPGDVVRVWVPACATGEEAYSIAILLLEHARRLTRPPALQVFACDLDEEAIARARAGLYTPGLTADVSEERLNRYFIKEPRGYRVRREVRETVLFAVHDLLKDAPFSRVDLISCRNLLIYLNREAQTRAINIFHFALRPGGRLFLGASETVEDDSPLFGVLDKKHRVYASKPTSRVGLPLAAASATLDRLLEAQQQADAAAPVLHGRAFQPETPVFPGAIPPPSIDHASLTELHFKLIERLSPPSVVVDADHHILHLSESAGRFLRFTGGEPTTDLLRLVNPALRGELRALLSHAAETAAPAESAGAALDLDGQPGVVTLHAFPAPEVGTGCLLVVFRAGPRTPDAPSGGESRPAPAALPETMVRQFEREIAAVKAQLRDTVEQYEASTEEMKANNEELQAMNEELRSASEELETSREELQSINEELTTVNQEMKTKMEELAHANSDLQNLMASTSIATIFLDRELAVTRYTPNAADIFYLIATDAGRPLAHVKMRLDYPELMADAETVLRTLVPVEREMDGSGRWFLIRLRPYRTVEDHIGGVVLTFVDVTERKLAEHALAEDLHASERLREISERLVPEGDMQTLFDEIVGAAVAIAHADAGTVQLFQPDPAGLLMLAHEGIPPELSDHYAAMPANGGTSCGQALAAGRRTVFHYDAPGLADTSEDAARHLRHGLVSAQSTPLVTRTGRPVGVMSTHWRVHHEPTARARRFLDLLARQAADAIERHQTDEALRAQMGELSRFNAVAVGRETRMIELKKTVNALAARLGEPPPHRLDFEREDTVPDAS